VAQRWSFKEDYIIAKFCQECQYQVIEGSRLDELMIRFDQNGFGLRTRNAVSKRSKDFLHLFYGGSISSVPKQIGEIYRVLGNDGYQDHFNQVKEFISVSRQDVMGSPELGSYGEVHNDLTHMVHHADKYAFVDVLNEYIKESGIRPKSRIYRDVGMSEDTFSAIRRGKYHNVSRSSLFKICFGLRLQYDDAVNLLQSCGCYFKRTEILDTVVEYFLRKGPTIDSINKVDGKEQVCYIYDTFAIDADLLESGASELFWGFRKGDDKDDEE
jgi:DNA-binding Xre family transcriptional regulator